MIITFVLILFIGGAIIYSNVSDGYSEYRGNHATPTEELQLARSLCPPQFGCRGLSVASESEMDIAVRHLAKIPPRAPEYSEAAKLRSLIQAFRVKAASRPPEAGGGNLCRAREAASRA